MVYAFVLYPFLKGCLVVGCRSTSVTNTSSLSLGPTRVGMHFFGKLLFVRFTLSFRTCIPFPFCLCVYYRLSLMVRGNAVLLHGLVDSYGWLAE